MTTLYLVRHGQVADASFIYGRTDMALSEIGVLQLSQLGEYFSEQGIIPDAVIASPLRRTMQSAYAVSRPFGILNIEQNEDLLEVNFGDEIVGKPFAFFAEVDDDLFTHTVEGKPRSLETPEQLVTRTLRAIDTIRKNHEDKTIFVIGHGDPLSFALWRLIHPEGDLPTVPQMEAEGSYLQKGDAAKLVLDNEGRLVAHMLIRSKEGKISEESNHRISTERK